MHPQSRLECATVEMLRALRTLLALLRAPGLQLGTRRFGGLVQLRGLDDRTLARKDLALRHLLERARRVPVVTNWLPKSLQEIERERGT